VGGAVEVGVGLVGGEEVAAAVVVAAAAAAVAAAVDDGYTLETCRGIASGKI